MLSEWKMGTHPVAGVDYPQTFQAMDEWFRNDAACRDYPPTVFDDARGLLLHRLAQQAVAVAPAPYHTIANPGDSNGHEWPGE